MIYIIASLLMIPALHAAPVIHDILDAKAMDRKVDPCENFYRYSCGTWEREFKLPADKSSYWRQGSALSDNVDENLNTLLSSLAAGKAKTASEKKLGAFYQSCMQLQDPDGVGLENLKARLSRLDHINSPETLASTLAELDLIGSPGLFDFDAEQDPKDSSRTIAFVDRGGMSLPDPDYYLKDDSKSRETREKFQEHVAKSLELVGMKPAEAKTQSARILAFEIELAKHALKKDDRRDMEKTFHPMTYTQLKELMPSFHWEGYFKALGRPTPKKFNVVEPEFFKNLNTLLPRQKPEDLSALLKYKLVHRSAYFIPGPLQKEDFAFWRAFLRGQKELPPRWKYCTQVISDNMGEALGKAYVSSVPGSESIRAKTQQMFVNIKQAFKEDLKALTWMDESTRASALKKLDKMTSKIGWPGKWRDYSRVKIDAKTFYENELAATEFEVRRMLTKIDQPTDRSEWYMQVWEPNAYYSQSDNEMVLPLGELVPPVFDPKFSEGANYASLGGSTIGHELTHGFDDNGKDMDASGNYVSWWTPQSKERFESQSACYVAQTEAYEIGPDPKLRIRGKATLGENLADNGGVKLGLVALKKLMKARPPAAKFLEFDEVQQFFLAYGQSWCFKVTDEALRQSLLSNYHAPAEFRVNAVLANMPEFAEAFQCKPGSKMAPKKRCSLW